MTTFFKATGEIRPLDVVAECDDAIDHAHEKTDWKEYEKTLNQSHLQLKTEAQPARFKIKPLTRDQLEDIDIRARSTLLAQNNIAFQQARRYYAFWSGTVTIKAFLQEGNAAPVLSEIEPGDWQEVVPGQHKVDIGHLVLLISERRLRPSEPDPGK